MITLKDLTIGYQEPLFKPLSGEFVTGSLTAIMGINGIGKSTLLRTICGLLEPLSGQVSFKKEQSQMLSWLPQQSDVDRDFPMTVFDVVAMGAWPNMGICRKLTDEAIDQIESALAQLGIIELSHLTIGQLSGGQFQRMLFARLLVQNTEVLLMDEPFVGIDNQTQQTLLQLILKLHQQGKTIVTVLHDPNIVADFFPETLMINEDCSHWGRTEDVFADCRLLPSWQKHSSACRDRSSHVA